MTRPRRSGISYIQNYNHRSITFFKRRAGLYKTAADLSTLTGAKIAIALESESGKMSSFGTPSAGPIIDSFLSGNAPVDPFVNEEEKSQITILQNNLFKVEKKKYMEDKRSKETTVRSKEIQETSRKSKLVYGKIDDLSVEELKELVHDLSEVEQDINDRLCPHQPSYQLEVGGSRDPFLQQSSSLSSQSQIRLPPRRLPWTPIQPSLQLPRSPWPLPQLSRSQSSLPIPSLLPSAQAQPMPLFQHSLMPQHPSTMQPQAQMMLSATEAYQHNYYTHGVHVNGNISQPFSQSSFVSGLPTPFSNGFAPASSSSSQQPPIPLPIESELHLAGQPENHPSTQDLTAGHHPFANHQWPSPIPSNEPYYNSTLYGLNFYLGDLGGYGGQAAGEHDMPGPSGQHQQAYDCPYRNFLGSSSGGESTGDYGPGNDHDDMGCLGDI